MSMSNRLKSMKFMARKSTQENSSDSNKDDAVKKTVTTPNDDTWSINEEYIQNSILKRSAFAVNNISFEDDRYCYLEGDGIHGRKSFHKNPVILTEDVKKSEPDKAKLNKNDDRKRSSEAVPVKRKSGNGLFSKGFKKPKTLLPKGKKDYLVCREIGQGTSGKVYLVQDTLKSYYALKGKYLALMRNLYEIKDIKLFVLLEIKLLSLSSEKEIQLAKEEVTFLQSLSHPNIIKFIEGFDCNETLCIVTEYAEGGDLHSEIRKIRSGLLGRENLSESIIFRRFIQLCLGLSYLHEHRIVHRDIKSRNILLFKNSPVIKIGDFGISTSLSNTNALANTAIGTPYYLSPEICSGKPYNFKTDMWALGCVLFEMVSLCHPFDANNLKELMMKITSGKLDVGKLKGVSVELVNLTTELLQSDPACRPTPDEILSKPMIRSKSVEFLLELKTLNRNGECEADTGIYYSSLIEKYDSLSKRYGEKVALNIIVKFLLGESSPEASIRKACEGYLKSATPRDVIRRLEKNVQELRANEYKSKRVHFAENDGGMEYLRSTLLQKVKDLREMEVKENVNQIIVQGYSAFESIEILRFYLIGKVGVDNFNLIYNGIKGNTELPLRQSIVYENIIKFLEFFESLIRLEEKSYAC